jgi:hypothetical protein
MAVLVARGVAVAVLVGVAVSVGMEVLVGVDVAVKVGLGVLVGVDVGWLRATSMPLLQTKIPAIRTAITAMTATTRIITRVLESLIAPPCLIPGGPTQFCAEVMVPQRKLQRCRRTGSGGQNAGYYTIVRKKDKSPNLWRLGP